MIRLTIAAIALMALCFPSKALDCPQSRYNVVCLNPEGPIIVTPKTRKRTFWMDGRTTDRDPRKKNVFWVVYGEYTAGNWENPKITLIEYLPPGPKTTGFEFYTWQTYGTQAFRKRGYGEYYLTVWLLDQHLHDLGVNPAGVVDTYLKSRASGRMAHKQYPVGALS